MSGGSDGTSTGEALRAKLRAVPVVDLRPAIAPPKEAAVPPASAPAPVEQPVEVPRAVEVPHPPQEAAPAPAAGPASDRPGWLVPFLAGVLAGAGAFYLVLWLRVLI